MGTKYKTGVDGVVQDDIRVTFQAVSRYLKDELDWLFPKIIDAALLLDKVYPTEHHNTALNFAESMLELRYRAKEAANFWSREIMILLNNDIDKGNTARPEEIKCLGASYMSLLKKFYKKWTSNTNHDQKTERSKRIMEAYFGSPDPIDHELTEIDERLEYAKDLFEIQVTYIL